MFTNSITILLKFIFRYRTVTILPHIAEAVSYTHLLSSRQTSRILYNRYGKNFLQKRMEARMAAAVTFLKENKLSISEISGTSPPTSELRTSSEE